MRCVHTVSSGVAKTLATCSINLYLVSSTCNGSCIFCMSPTNGAWFWFECFVINCHITSVKIPETPCWLLSRNRRADALQSLQWLRGWVSPQHVDKEFTEITRYMDQTRKRCDSCQNTDSIMCQHSVSRLKLWQDMLLPSTYRPFLLTMLVFMTCQFNGLVSIRPYLVQIFQTFGFPLDPNWASVRPKTYI